MSLSNREGFGGLSLLVREGSMNIETVIDLVLIFLNYKWYGIVSFMFLIKLSGWITVAFILIMRFIDKASD